MTSHPAAASRKAVARPIPREAPVISAVGMGHGTPGLADQPRSLAYLGVSGASRPPGERVPNLQGHWEIGGFHG
jgi:hypothetical protein